MNISDVLAWLRVCLLAIGIGFECGDEAAVLSTKWNSYGF